MQKKQEKGSITVLVLASIMLILIVLVNIYVASSNKNRSGREAFRKIQDAYNMTDAEMQLEYENIVAQQT